MFRSTQNGQREEQGSNQVGYLYKSQCAAPNMARVFSGAAFITVQTVVSPHVAIGTSRLSVVSHGADC